MTLTDIANAAGTDKGTVAKEGHGYSLVYDQLFSGRRNQHVDLLEVGLQIGGPELGFGADRAVTDAPSLRMWREYFPQRHIHGVDISDFSAYSAPDFSFHRADCGSDEALAAINAKGLALDLIVEDGSHASFHQQLTFIHLFPLLRPGGLFIFEDLHWQPPEYEASLPRVDRTSTLLRAFRESGRFTGGGALGERLQALAPQIGGIVIIDWPELAAAGDAFNRLRGLKRQQPHHLGADAPLRKRLKQRLQPRWALDKLAIIQKL